MSRSFITLEVSAAYAAAAPTIQVLVGGIVVSSATVTAHTGAGFNSLSFMIDYVGDYPSSLSFRFSDGSAEAGRSITFEKFRVDGWAVDNSHLSALILSQSQSSNVNAAAIDHLFGVVEPLAADLGTPTITGTAALETLSGTSGNDIINGLAGNDTIRGNAGDDAITGGADNDAVYGGLGNDLILGEAGNDSLFGNENDDLVYGGSGADTIDGGDGKDLVNGGDGKDTLRGGTDDDIIIGGKDADIIYGGTGVDSAVWNVNSAGFVIYRDNASYITVIDTNDTTANGYGADKVYNDVEYIVFNDVTVNLSSMPFLVKGAGWGTSAAQYGTALANTMYGTAGDDTVYGGDGNDRLYGRHGNDSLHGENGIDNILGEGGNDILDGGAGNDTLNGGEGDDTLTGGKGNDTIYGGLGVDSVVMNVSSAGFIVYRSATANIVVLDTNDKTANGQGSDKIFNDVELLVFDDITFDLRVTTFILKGDGTGTAVPLYGTATANALYGTAGIDTIYGGDGADTLFGRQGNDSLFGEGGNDRIYGEAGNDTVDGGTGTDTVNYSLTYGTGVTVNLGTAGAQNTGGSGIDTLVSIENLTGSGLGDTLTGDGGNNVILGGAGNDLIEGGAGDDTLNGEAGTNTLTYANAASAVTVSLAIMATQNTGGAGTDRVSNFQNLTGSTHNDTLTGSAANNVINGGDGNDTIVGGDGDDTLEGGNGTDKVVYTGSVYDYSFDFSDPDILVITDDVGSLGTDSAHDVEQFQFSEGTYTRAELDALQATQPAIQFHFDWGTGTYNFVSTSNGVSTLTAAAIGYSGAAGDQFSIDRSFSAVTLTYLHADAPGGVTITGSDSFDDLLVAGIVSSLAATINMDAGNDIVTITSAGDFTINGEAGDDDITAGAGNDIIAGGSGNDALDGGGGSDTAHYGAAAAGVTVNLSTGTAANDGDGGADTLANIENVTGSAFTDTLTGDSNANIIAGGGGDDALAGGAGNDTLDGEAGTDTVNYSAAAAGVMVSLATGSASNDGDGGADTLSNIENVTGSGFNDTIEGSSANNLLAAGAGVDTLSYANAASAVTVSLSLQGGSQNTVGAGTDTLSGFENLTGSTFGDTLTGDNNANVIDGGGGADTINAGDGDDTINLANGNFTSGESLTGGIGADSIVLTNATTVDFSTGTLATMETLTGSTGNDTVTLAAAQAAGVLTAIDLAGGTDILNIAGTSDITAATLATISNVETGNVTGTAGNDTFTLTGAQLNTIIIGSGTINMGGGTDTINLTATSADLNTLGATDASIQSVEAISFAAAAAGVTITLSGQTEGFTITGSASDDTITAGGGNDTINLTNGHFIAGESLTGGSGTDAIVLTNATTVDFTTGTLSSIETLTGSTGNDTVTMNASSLAGMFTAADLGGGTDTLNVLASGSVDISAATIATISNTETGNLIGTTGNETLTITGAQLNAIIIGSGTINMNAGTDTINLTSTSADLNTLGATDASIQGVETISASGAAAGVTINMAGQTEALTITGSANADTITGGNGTSTLTGGAGGDTITSGSVDTITATINSILAANAGVSYDATTGNFYKYVSGASTWAAANTAAAVTLTGGGGTLGHLVHVTSAYEQGMIDTLVGTNAVWMGGTDQTTEGAWLWSGGALNGKQFWSGAAAGTAQNGFYTNWAAGQPDNAGGGTGSDWLDMNGTGRWRDSRDVGAQMKGYVIEWEGSSILAPTSNTTLKGGDGLDSLYGAAGQDVFLFEAASAFNNKDVVYNYNVAHLDKIDIKDLLTGYTPGTSDVDLFARFTVSGADLTLQVDRDGSGGGFAFADVATLNGLGTSNLNVEELVAKSLLVMS